MPNHSRSKWQRKDFYVFGRIRTKIIEGTVKKRTDIPVIFSSRREEKSRTFEYNRASREASPEYRIRAAETD